MELLKKLKGLKELEPSVEQKSRYFEFGRSEGAPYLFYKGEEFCDLMGHEIIYYPNGVLLRLKDNCKDFETSKSFVFYNNNKLRVAKAHNRISVFDFKARMSTYRPPEKDIEVKVYQDYIYVRETNFKTKEVEEQIISVHTGEKLNNIIESNQLSIDL